MQRWWNSGEHSCLPAARWFPQVPGKGTVATADFRAWVSSHDSNALSLQGGLREQEA